LIGFLHYSAPPVVGGVEAVIAAHAGVFMEEGYPVTIIAGEGDERALPAGAGFIRQPVLSSIHPEILEINAALEAGKMPAEFEPQVDRVVDALSESVTNLDLLIVHNVFTKHFNLPLTAALHRMVVDRNIERCIAWTHDLSWTSPNSRRKLHPGYPWQLLRDHRPEMTYVAVSEHRARELAETLSIRQEEIRVIYNGIELVELLGLSQDGAALADRLDLFSCDLVLLMPIRVTRAKNIEYAIQVMAKLKERIDRPRLILTGPPDPHDPDSLAYLDTLRDLRKELEVENEFRFVYESGPIGHEPYTIEDQVVGDLYRLSDVMFMPSHREGFGMPVLEAGLAGNLVVCTDVPAAAEIGRDDVVVFAADRPPAELADRILELVQANPICQLRRRTRQRFTWKTIFQRDIKPILGF
jgi:mannosylglucosylglycerate synthase